MERIPNGWDLKSVMALSYCKGIHCEIVNEIINKYNCFEEFLQNAFIIDKSASLFFQDKNDKDLLAMAEEQIEIADNFGFKIVSFWNDDYPDLLKHIHHPPIILYYKGTLQVPNAFMVSIVGTRKCTRYGTMVAEKFAAELCNEGIIIVSGMANGIDSVAHRTTIKNNGITYAVMASGLDKINPSYANKFSEEIVASGGAIISEYKIGTSAQQGYFLQRNRIISGLSKATIVVESDFRGGALNTAGHASQQNREVYAVPGNIFSDKSKGTNNLIHSLKAKIITDSKQVLKDIEYVKENTEQENIAINEDTYQSTNDNSVGDIIMRQISYEEIHIDEIVANTKLDISTVLVQLFEMEFNGDIKKLAGNYYIKSV